MTETPILTFKNWKFFKIKPDSRKYSTILLIQPITSWRNIYCFKAKSIANMFFLPSLQHMAYSKIAVTLCNQKEMKAPFNELKNV
ncbi:hypothetical protein CEXT_224141 [Caerostris extrusa]|uniref:Uncharacterized protein n=1 Tax=Caerostris extrusa TaxID=172846 RepID=A0AAV4MSJ7_CAEEX|nr:hypothetical protein CEXT_224141 [Caerostris extrusa]